MKLWVDDVRPAPDGWTLATSVAGAMALIENNDIDTISLDHDAGYFAIYGGDYIRILDWLEATGLGDSIAHYHIHSMNPVGVANMRRIIEKNGWDEIYTIV